MTDSHTVSSTSSHIFLSQNNAVAKKRTFWDRLIIALKRKHLPTSQAAIGAMVKISQTGARKWKESPPPLPTVVTLAEKTDVAVEWLLTERGPMEPLEYLTEDEVRLVKLYRQLSDRKREKLMSWAEIEASMPDDSKSKNSPAPNPNSLDTAGPHISLK